MLMDVIDAVSEAGLLSRCFVITSSPRARSISENLGAKVVVERKDLGVNAAIEEGLKATDSEELVVIPGDLPLLRGAEIKGAVDLKKGGMDVVVTPSAEFDGTNLLVFARSVPMKLSFDRDSFWNHLDYSSGRGYRVAIHAAKGCRFDVDTVGHFRALARIRTRSRAASFAREASRS